MAIAQSEIDLSGDGGVLKQILKEGSGETPPHGFEVRGNVVKFSKYF